MPYRGTLTGQKWAGANLRKFNKAKYRLLPMNEGKPKAGQCMD